MVSFLLALSFIQINGFGDWIIYVLFVISVVTAVLFIRTERRVAEPMVDLQLFKNRLFSVNIGTALLAFIASAGITLLIPLYLQDVMGFDTQKTGLWMVISPIAMALVAPISGMLSDKIGSRLLTTIGLSVALAGYIVLTTFTANTSMLVYSITFILTGAGTGFFQSPNNSAVMGSSPKERLGVASGLLSLTRVLGQTAGVSILGTIWASNVIHFAGSFQGADATQAPKAAQVAGLHVASLSIVGIISVAVFFSAWALISVSRTKRADEPEV